jgi:phytoene dehydrogenase-like protein
VRYDYDAVVVGAGPNGLAASITLAEAGCSVLLIEANREVGGACRSGPLTLPGFVHDVCSAIHPLAVASPFFRRQPLEKYGLKWIEPPLPLAHPLPDQPGVSLHRDLKAQARQLGQDGEIYRRLMQPFVSDWEDLAVEALQPLPHFPRKPWLLVKFGMQALRSASHLARNKFGTEPARALFGGLAAHSFLALDKAGSSAVGLVLGTLAHAVGWPLPEGGAGKITQALNVRFQRLGGLVETNRRVKNIDELPPSRVLFLDLTPRRVVSVAGHRLPAAYRRSLEKFRYGPAVFKIDYALSSPIPWRYPDCREAGTVHLGGTLAEIELAEKMAFGGAVPECPFVLLAQPSLFDRTRAPAGKHTAWAYCHVPHGCEIDMTQRIEGQIERFAPGFRDCVIAKSVRGPRTLEEDNANLVGGDINGGLADLWQLVARPVLSFHPYRTPLKGTYLCSASTPPGGGVHGMAGYNAALLALQHEFGQ